jgi:hypothetical protein
LASCTVGHVLFASPCTACIWTHDDCQQSSNLHSLSEQLPYSKLMCYMSIDYNSPILYYAFNQSCYFHC